jgi:small subunit ribosomal protein S6
MIRSFGVSAFVCLVEPFRGSKGFAPGSRDNLRKAMRMALYEHIYLARQDISAQQVETLTEQFRAILDSLGGRIEKVEYWGVKSLAYRISKNRKAHFTLLNIDAPPAAITEMERQSGLNEDVIRFLTIRVETLEAGQSAMMRKRDDDDRGDRGDRPDRGDRNRGPRPDRGPRRQRDDAGPSEGAF